MNTSIHDIDKCRRIENTGFSYDNGLTYSTRLFTSLDEKTGKEIESKCFYFLAGPFYRNQLESLIDKMSATEFDNYMKHPDNTRFRFVPAHTEII